MVPKAPNYPKLLKRLGFVYLGWIIVWVPLVFLAEETSPPKWLEVIAILAPIGGFVVASTLVMRAFVREERERKRALYPPTSGVERPRLTPASMVRAVGLPWFVFSCLALLGLPLTIIGAMSHVHWLLVAGLVLLVAELVDQSTVRPTRRARSARAGASTST